MRSKVVVLTCHGRGYPLALDLARRSIPAIVVDFSKCFSREAADLGGPVGLFDPPGTGETKRWVVANVLPVEERQMGFIVWTKQGPIEFRGPLGMHQWKSHGLEENLSDYLSVYMNQPPSINWEEVEFEKVWPLHLANVLTLNRELDYPKSLSERWRTPLFASYSYVDFSSINPMLKDLEDKGLEVYQAQGLKDVRINPDGLSAIDLVVDGKNLEVVGTEYLSCLTRFEWEFLNINCSQSLFTNPSQKPFSRWQRWKVSFNSNRFLDSAPEEFLILGDLYDVWKNENMVILRRAESGWNVWMKVDHSASNEELKNIFDRFVTSFNERIPGLEVETVDLGSTEPLWSVWEGDNRLRHIHLDVSNCKMMGPDGGERFDFLSRWHHGESSMDWLLQRIHRREGEKEKSL